MQIDKLFLKAISRKKDVLMQFRISSSWISVTTHARLNTLYWKYQLTRIAKVARLDRTSKTEVSVRCSVKPNKRSWISLFSLSLYSEWGHKKTIGTFYGGWEAIERFEVIRRTGSYKNEKSTQLLIHFQSSTASENWTGGGDGCEDLHLCVSFSTSDHKAVIGEYTAVPNYVDHVSGSRRVFSFLTFRRPEGIFRISKCIFQTN